MDLKDLRKRQIAYKEAFENPKGQQVLLDLAKECNFSKTSHVIGDAYTTAFNEGKRAVYLHIAKILGQNLQDALFNPGTNFKVGE